MNGAAAPQGGRELKPLRIFNPSENDLEEGAVARPVEAIGAPGAESTRPSGFFDDDAARDVASQAARDVASQAAREVEALVSREVEALVSREVALITREINVLIHSQLMIQEHAERRYSGQIRGLGNKLKEASAEIAYLRRRLGETESELGFLRRRAAPAGDAVSPAAPIDVVCELDSFEGDRALCFVEVGGAALPVEVEAGPLRESGLREGMRFRWAMTRDGPVSSDQIRPLPPPRLSDEEEAERRRLYQELRDGFSDEDLE